MNLEMGNKIKQLRLDRGMTQEQLGNELSVSAQAVSKWESSTTLPDIQLLPEISVLFGVSIDELFSMTDESRMDRIENMIEGIRFIPQKEFDESEKFLKGLAEKPKTKARASLVLAELYNKRLREYQELSVEFGKKALLLNPNEKSAHNAVYNGEGGAYGDYNASNHIETIGFYKDFINEHPENPRTYLWLMDLLIEDGRTAEARVYLNKMDKIEHTFRTEFYLGNIAKVECDLPGALGHWERMTEEFPEDWLSWSCKADAYARLCRYDEAIEFYKKSMELQPAPRFMDNPEAISYIYETQGDYEKAIEMRKTAIEICITDWNITEGEWVDEHYRAIERLKMKMGK